MERTNGEKAFQWFNYIFLTVFAITTLYPFWYVIVASISKPSLFMQHEGILLWPKGLSIKSYNMVFKNPSIYIGYKNTLFYVIVGTAFNLIATIIASYVLSRKYLRLKKYIMLLIIFTMYFNGGLIPNYLLIKGLHLDNTRWVLIIPGLIGTWNLIIMTTSFKSIPMSLEESARIDGAGEWTILFKIIVPLSIPVIMVMVLYYGVAHWNSWFGAMIYLRDNNLYPLQLFLRNILINNKVQSMMAGGSADVEDIGTTVKYATIIVSTLPILAVYPFIQKYFVKGVMIGAIKE